MTDGFDNVPASGIDRLRRRYAALRQSQKHTQYLLRVMQERDFIEKCLSHREMLTESVRLSSYVEQVLAERYWIEEAIPHKDFVLSALDRRKGEERAKSVFTEELALFREKSAATRRGFTIDDDNLLPQLSDRMAETPFDRHYLYHPAWAARILAKTRPTEHVDIGSILQFSTMLSAFVPVRFYDYRPAVLQLSDLASGSADLTALAFEDGSISSLSCMHVLEHIGLGRYGDPVDPDGDLKAIGELVRVLAPGGDLLVATPVGRKRICFNAHRVYDHEEFAAHFAPLRLMEFALIEEHGERGPIAHASAELARDQSYGCGCFWFKKEV